MRCFLVIALMFLMIAAPGANVQGEDPPRISSEQEKFFESKIRPVLAKSCYECHSAKKQQAGLRVDAREFLIKGGEGGSVLTPARLDESRMWEVLQHDPLDTQMPPDGKLADEVLADFKAWIEMGAPWPTTGTPVAGAADHKADWSKHWAFQPIQHPAVPAVNNQDWPINPIDQFILAKLEQNGIAPAPAADRATLIRRLKYDLLGLPATFEEIESFTRNESPTAYAELVEQYLASPHFGERWGRHWLDISRYADTKGYVFTEDRNYPDAWKYREWVIKAFNGDLPYDRFVITQLAADKSSDKTDDLNAMGYLTLGRRFLNNPHDIIDDRLDVVFRGMMGLTVACARCHDHKYDPIPTADYYSLYGVFASSDEPKNEPSTLRMVDKEKPYEPVVFLRGQAGNRGPEVPRQFLEVIERDNRKPFSEGSGRLEMAQKIASPDNPLTARVWANRVCGHLFGRELVRTPSDFGVRSDPPSHPELLDHLASLLIENGWSTKSLISEIVLSASYRQSSRADAELAKSDPENSLISHMNRKRVDFEGLRDAMLAVSGRIDLTVGGQSVRIENQPFPTRRTVYAFIDRQNLPGVFRTFDFAGPDTHAPRRFETNVPQQALFLMNSPFVMEQAAALAERAKRESSDETIRTLYAFTLGRTPCAEELALAKNYLSATPAPVDDGKQPN
ncbi:MAG TPA: PSD1 and planctomycete cytochrome C domain-containing protein, partial [Planctomycetaceae bacterium]|nr:PSD1 and planctomycete cytochrome C domain-containing protein [Planctomycetaceae bacterium]